MVWQHQLRSRGWFTAAWRWLTALFTAAPPSSAQVLHTDRFNQPHRLALRLVWEASGEFSGEGWGRHDIEALRLVCLNLERDQIMGARVAERLRRVIAPVVSGVADRLNALAQSARLVDEVEPLATLRLETSTGALIEQLEGLACRAGEPVPFDPQRVVSSAENALAQCAEIRESLRSRVSSELGTALQQICTQHAQFAARWQAGDLLLDLSRLPSHRQRVAVEPDDLDLAIIMLIGALFESGRAVGPVRLQAIDDGPSVKLSVSWTADDRLRLDPARLIRPLRALAAYGVRHALSEAPDQDAIELSAWFPLGGRQPQSDTRSGPHRREL
jgi:hypothetical protein